MLFVRSGLQPGQTVLVQGASGAALVGAQRVRRATPELVLAATGQEVGGVAPVGHPARLRTVVDVDLATHPLRWAGGGDHSTMIGLTYADLLRATGAAGRGRLTRSPDSAATRHTPPRPRRPTSSK